MLCKFIHILRILGYYLVVTNYLQGFIHKTQLPVISVRLPLFRKALTRYLVIDQVLTRFVHIIPLVFAYFLHTYMHEVVE